MNWLEVREAWRQSEEEGWRPVYTERGFSDWWSWRSSYLVDLGLDKLAWSRETIPNPLAMIPKWFVGGYRGWKKYLPHGAAFGTFSEIATHPELPKNKKVMDVVADLRPVHFIVLHSGSDMVVLDGSHRAAAIAVLAHAGATTVPPAEMLVADIDSARFDQFRLGRPSIGNS